MFGKFKWIVSIVKLTFNAHHGQFDVIRVNEHDFEQLRKCWFASLGLFTFTVLYGIFGLECESSPSCNLNWTALATSPYNFYHQMFPSAIWREINLLALSLFILAIGSWICLLYNPPIECRYLIFPDTDGKNKKDELEQMYTFRVRFLKLALVMEITIYLYGIMFVYVNVFRINANYNVNLTSILFWTLFNPIHLYFLVVFLYSSPCYVILASRYITIQQKALTTKLADLNLKLDTIRHYPELSVRRAVHNRAWQQYLSVNGQICDLCGHMREYARFWSPLLTMLFAAFISFQCYIFYMFLFVTGLSAVWRILMLLAILGVIFNELLLITQCAAVVKHFGAITRQNRTFYQRYRNAPNVGKVLGRNLAKAESLQDSRLLHSYAFRLFGNYRITTKSFHIIISYISIFFLFIVKNKQ